MRRFAVHHSQIHGVGVFARSLIRRGEVFYVVPTRRVGRKPHRGYAHIGHGRFVHDPRVLDRLNHSCDPNSIFVIGTARPYLRAKKNILRGQEITCDYSKTERGGVRVPCTCGSSKCRHYFRRIE